MSARKPRSSPETAAAGSRSPGEPRIELHIERLVLEGIDARHGNAVRAALQAQLQRHIALAAGQHAAGSARAPLRSSASHHTLDCGSIDVARNVRPGALGDALAGAIWRGITR